MWNFLWLDIDSSLQTSDSKWLNSSCDSNLESHDSTLTRLDKILHDSDCDSTLILQKWLNHCWALIVSFLSVFDM